MRRGVIKRPLPALLALFAWGSLALANSQPQQTTSPASKAPPAEHPPTIQSNVRQVLVPVVVTDKKGHYVTDLKASDFQVFENGRPETIVAFSTSNVDTANAPEASQAVQPSPAVKASSPPAQPGIPKRTYLVLIDTLHSSFANFVGVRKALTKFFEQEHSEDSRYALMALGRQIQIVQDSTPDPGLILAALRGKQLQTMILQSETSNTSFEVGRFVELVGQYCTSCGCATIPAVAEQVPLCAARTGMVRAFLTRYSERTVVLDQDFLQQLRRLVDAAASMPTARTIILFSDGFNRFPGQELYTILQGFAPNDSSSFSSNARDTQSELDTILRIAIRYDVKFYTLDSRGLYTANSFAGSSLDVSHWGVTPEAVDRQTIAVAHQNTDALSELAHETGGLFFENNNDLLKGIRRAFADGRESYVLAYVPTNKVFDGKYRTIRVVVKGKGLVVHAKPGYWATN